MWKSGDHTTMVVGNLDSYRSIIHPVDVAEAIHLILSQDTAGRFVIANKEAFPMFQLVEKMYTKAGIDVKREGDRWIDQENGKIVLMISEHLGGDTTPTCIRGVSNRLNSLGWKLKKTADDILDEYVHESI